MVLSWMVIVTWLCRVLLVVSLVVLASVGIEVVLSLLAGIGPPVGRP